MVRSTRIIIIVMSSKGLNLAAKPFVPPGSSSSPDTLSTDEDKSTPIHVSNRVSSARASPANIRESPLWDLQAMTALADRVKLPPHYASHATTLYAVLGLHQTASDEDVRNAFLQTTEANDAALTSMQILGTKGLRRQYDSLPRTQSAATNNHNSSNGDS